MKLLGQQKIQIKEKAIIVDREDFEKVNRFKWHINTRGYVASSFSKGKINGKWSTGIIKLHRFITDCPKGMEVDHINGNPLDNRKANLRIVTRKQNSRNSKVNRRNLLKLKGVSFDGRKFLHRPYFARITVDGKTKHLGSFATAKEAHSAYIIAAKKYFKEFVRYE